MKKLPIILLLVSGYMYAGEGSESNDLLQGRSNFTLVQERIKTEQGHRDSVKKAEIDRVEAVRQYAITTCANFIELGKLEGRCGWTQNIQTALTTYIESLPRTKKSVDK